MHDGQAHEPDAVLAPREPLRDLHLHAQGRAAVERGLPASIAPHIVVGAESHDMVKSDVSPQIFEFDYKLPAFQTDIGYYYVVDYSAQNAARNSQRRPTRPSSTRRS
jgi:hypothetical protein